MTNTTMVDRGVHGLEQNNSPIIGEMEEDFDAINQGTEGLANCFSIIQRIPTTVT